MNQEAIMKSKMVTAIVIAFAMLIAAFVFAGLYYDQIKLNRQEYIDEYEKNLAEAADEIDVFLEKQTDFELHYNMALSDLGAARAMIFKIDDKTEEQKAINEILFCFVKYPVQMRERLGESSQAFHDIADHLDKGYDEVRAIVDSIDRLGN